MTTYPTQQMNPGYINISVIPGNPGSTVYTPTTSWRTEPMVDCSFIGTTFGLLKSFQQIFIIISTVLYMYILISANYMLGTVVFGILLYVILISILMPVVHVLMWGYILHKVEKFNRYPWYTIEIVICGGGAVLCLLAALFPLYAFIYYRFTVATGLTTVVTCFTALLFIYNLVLVSQKQTMKIPLQGPEPTL